VKIEILMALATIKKGKAKQAPHKKMCEVCAKTTNVARHALRSWKSTHTHFDKGRKHSESKESRESKERKSIPGSKGKVKVAHQSDFVLPTWEGNLHPQSL